MIDLFEAAIRYQFCRSIRSDIFQIIPQSPDAAVNNMFEQVLSKAAAFALLQFVFQF